MMCVPMCSILLLHIGSGTQLSAAFAPGPEKIAHSDFTCELKNNMKADFSAGGVVEEKPVGAGQSSAALRVVLTSFYLLHIAPSYISEF